MKKTLLVAALMLLGSMAVKAIPAYPAKKVVTISDGSTATFTLRGDEHFSFYTDEQGQTYQLINDNYIPVNKESIRTIWTNKMQKATQARARRTAATRVGESIQNLTGKKKGIVILMEFQDQKFEIDNPKAVFQDFFNKEGYTEYGMTGSVKDYFKAQSYNQFELDFDIAGPYTASQKMAYYGAHDGNNNDKNPIELITEACKMADEEVNFADYDWDGDGEVDQVFVIYAGYNEAQGADVNTIWPHEWAISASGTTLTLDNTVIDTYACSSELRGSGKSTQKSLDGIGTACHEFSHCLGLPDFYDTNGDNFGMGDWDVMCSGSYNNGSRTPAGYTSYERMFAGWLTPIELNAMTRINNMKSLAESGEAYILYNDKNKDEYYLLENRQFTGFDAGLAAHGLLVLHVDYNEEVWASNTVNNAANRQRMTIIPADGKASRYNESGDPFPGSSNVTELTNYTTPAATLYNENADGQKLMSKPIDNITESEDGLISFVACRPELGIPEPDDGKEVEGEASFIVSWPAVSGAVGYELELTEIGTASDNPQEALEREFNFDEMVSKSVGFSDVSSQLSKYGLSGWKGSKLFTSPNKMKIGTSTAAGYVLTRDWTVPASAELTVVMGADVAKTGETVKGELVLASYNDGDSQYTKESQKFEVTGNERKVFNFSCRRDGFRIEVRPESQMYLNYLAVYDGVWTAEQLGISKARQYAPRKATTVNTYKTETNSCTLKDLNTRSRFFYRVRAIGEENTYSQWSEEKTFNFSTSGLSETHISSIQKYIPVYDLHGKCLGTDPSILRKGIYIIGGKKIVK